MNLLDFFKEYLLTRDSRPSKATVKNYLADVRKFILWFEETHRRPFSPAVVTNSMIERFKADKLARIRRGTAASSGFAASSVDRYASSLRKFFTCLKENGLIGTSPFDVPTQSQASLPEDFWHLKAFKNFLYQTNNSPLTIKNYIIDVRHFMSWTQQVTKATEASFIVDKRSLFQKITPVLIDEYKSRLLHQLQLSPVSINRKLSSIRKYLLWASDQGLLANLPPQVQNIAVENANRDHTKQHQSISKSIVVPPSEAKLPVKTEGRTYSSFPPLRLMQKLGVIGTLLFDLALVAPFILASEKLQYFSWLISGKRLFVKSGSRLLESASLSTIKHIKVDPVGEIIGSVPNYKKSFYAPHLLSTEGMPLHKRILHHIRFSRPKWYKKYHAYPLVHYVHFAILVIFMSAVGFGLYRTYVIGPEKQSQVLAAKTSPPRVLSFQGRLTDTKDNPITAQTNLRFGVYNNQTASGSALLWQEVQGVKPDQDGIFSVLLGQKTPIPQSLFGENASLFIGITVGRDQELTPRQQIATVAYATNAELLQGMPAITQPNAGTTNVVLALDSAGNLTIGGSASPTFQATGGTLTLSGQVLNLTTTTGSNGNVIISPDGTGTLDIQKPIQNTSNGNTIPGISGAVQFSDHVGIYNTSAQSGLSIYQTGTGNVITASQSGTVVFRVNNSGSGYFGQAIGIGELNPGAKLHVNTGGDSTSAIFNSSATPNTIFSFLSNGSEFGTISRNSNNDFELTSFGTSTDIILNPGGNVGIGTTIPSDFLLQVDGDIGPNIDASFDLGSSDNYWSTLYVNEINATSTLDFSSQAIFNNGLTVIAGQSFVLEGLNGTNSVLYSTSGSGTVAAASVGAAGYCLVSGASAPTWASCASAASTSWDIVNGAITPKQASTLDLLIGGDSTASAKFAVLNVSGGTPVVYTSGNLGIGTSTPGANADIVGTLRASGAFTLSSLTTNGGLLYTNGTGVVAQTSAGSISECLISNGGGAPSWGPCSGTGTGSNWDVTAGAYSQKFPSADLLIGGASTASAKFAFINVASGTPTASISGNIVLNSAGSIQTTQNQTLTLGGTTTGNIEFSPGGSSNPTMTLLGSGNVGIGTTEPNATFQIQGPNSPTNGPVFELMGDAAGQGESGRIRFRESSTNYTGAYIHYDGNADLLHLGTNPGGIGADDPRLSIKASDGNIGIGTTNPLQKFHMDSTDPVRSRVEGHTENYNIDLAALTTGPQIDFGDMDLAADQFMTIGSYNTVNNIDTKGRDLRIFSTANPTGVIFKQDSGNMGIGTTTPSSRLDVNGNLSVAGTATASALAVGYSGIGAGTGNAIISGNVGIGTTSPIAKLDIDGSASLSGILSFRGTTDPKIDILNGEHFGIRTSVGGTATERFTVRNNGNIGIGTTAPSALVHVVGGDFILDGCCGESQLQFSNVDGNTMTMQSFYGSNVWSSNAGARNIGGSGFTRFMNDEATQIAQLNDGSIRFRYAPAGTAGTLFNWTEGVTMINGNVGIGTTAPLAALDVQGNATVSGALKLAGAARAIQTTAMNTLTLGGDTTGNILVNPRNGTAGGFFGPAVDNVTDLGASSTARFRDLYLGPSSLHVQCTTGDGCGGGGIDWSIGIPTTGVARDGLQIGVNRSGFTSGTPGLTLTTSGNLGIGTTTPTNAKLDIAGSINLSSGNAYLINGVSVFSGSSLGSGVTSSSLTSVGTLTNLTVNDTGTLNLNATTDIEFTIDSANNGGLTGYFELFNGSGNNVFSVTEDGAVSADGNIVVSSGNFFDTSHPTVSNPAAECHNASTGEIGYCGSDARLKKNIRYLNSEGLAIVRGLKPARFDWIEGRQNEVGFIAQDVLAVAPNSVIQNSDGFYGLSQQSVLPYAIRAIQELDTQVQQLNSAAGNANITDSGNISVFKDPSDPAGVNYAIQNGSQTITRLAAFSEAVIANLRVGLIRAQEVIISGTLNAARIISPAIEAGSILASELTVRGTVMASRVSAESITVAGMTLRDYIISVSNSLQTYTPTVVSPVDGRLAVNILSPIAEDADVEVRLEQDSVKVTNKAGETAAEIDNTGNATFAGTLTAEKVQTQELDLSEEGLNKLRDQIGTQSATTINNITNVYQTIATPSATPTPTATPTQAPTPTVTPSPTATPTQTPATTIQSDYANMASMSGILGYVPSLKADFAQFTEGLMTLGPSSLNDVSVAGNLTVNGSMTLASNSINVLGADLEIQPLRQGNVSFMSGLVKIDIDGNMSVAGNATFTKNVTVRGVFAANVISPIPSQDLIFELPETRSTDANGNVAIKQSDLIIKNASGSGVLRVNQLGDLIASGSGSFKQLATEGFKIVRGAQADTSLTVTVASASAGTAVITGGQTERTIVSSFVREDSLIYITALSDTEGLTPYVARQTAEDIEERLKGSFTVQIPKKATKDIKINWWIVN